MKNKFTKLSVNLPTEYFKFLQKTAEQQDLNMSQIVRKIFKKIINQELL